MILTISNVETFVCSTSTAVPVEEMTGVGMMTEKTRGTAVFHQEALNAPK